MKLQILISCVLLLTACSYSGEDSKLETHLQHTRQLVLHLNETSWTTEADTILFIDAYDKHSDIIYGTVWTPEKSINFERNGDDLFIRDNAPMFSDFILQHLTKWNTDIIKEREENQGPLLAGNVVNVQFIVNDSKAPKIKHFSFYEFEDSIRGLNRRTPHNQSISKMH